MRRLLRLVVSTVCATVVLSALAVASPAIALERNPASTSPIAPVTQVATDTNDFTFDSWHSELQLGLTAEGRSQLTTTETIVARFPESDQNRGIRRAIPSTYQGHPTGLEVESVTDENGVPRSYETESTSDDSGDYLELTIAADDYVHGANTYRITYHQTNVTFVPDDSDSDEFFWEINGTGWAQPFADVSATLHIDPAITDDIVGVRCLQGDAASTADCAQLSSEADGDGWRIDAATGPLNAHEGLALVVGFEPATFVPRDESFLASPFPTVGLVGALAGLAALALAVVGRTGRWRSAAGRPTIIAEYLPPKGVSLLNSADVSGTTGKLIPALILHFAVRGNLRVLAENDSKKYRLELVHADGLEKSELRVLKAIFPGLKPGKIRALAKKDQKLAAALQAEVGRAPKEAIASGLREKRGGALKVWVLVLGILALPLAFFGSIFALVDQVGGFWPLLTLVVGVPAAIAALILVAVIRPLTAAGAELRDYLAGLKLYIKLAEADRMRVLQSPDGALRSPYRPDAASAGAQSTGAAGDPQLDVIKLSERLLPYAALFGLEKAWSAVLGDYYARSGTEPDWYYGSQAFNAAYFGSAIAAFSSTTTSSWAGTASSSSSSGFSGGGSVGGGGGGGGGGGV